MALLLSLTAVAALACQADEARYVLRHDPDVTAWFQPVESGPDWPSGLALAVHSRSAGQTSWWLPWSGGSDNLQNIASTMPVTTPGWRPPNPDGGPRPHGNRQLLSLDSDYTVLDRVPRRGGPAPAHMLIPNAGSSGDTAFPSKQFFDLVGCSAKRD